jgi:hypothetical protein
MDAELADAAWHREMAKFVIARSEATKQSSRLAPASGLLRGAHRAGHFGSDPLAPMTGSFLDRRDRESEETGAREGSTE